VTTIDDGDRNCHHRIQSGADMVGEPEKELDVHLAVEDNAIVVTLPGTRFSVIYRKTADNPWLLASDMRDDDNSPISRWSFVPEPGPQSTRRRENLGGLRLGSDTGRGPSRAQHT
jgi:hypothetical protein